MLTDQAHAFITGLAVFLELAGVVVIMIGAVISTVHFGRCGFTTKAWRSAYADYRADLGRAILLGLEFLVGADIIKTITAPLTVESVGLLAGVVLIRTFLSFALETEIQGRWPWRRVTAPIPDRR